MDAQNTGYASNIKGTLTAEMRLMKEEAEVKKKLEAALLHGEEQKARMMDFDPKLMRMVNGDFEQMGYDELKTFHDKLVKIQHERINNRFS